MPPLADHAYADAVRRIPLPVALITSGADGDPRPRRALSVTPGVRNTIVVVLAGDDASEPFPGDAVFRVDVLAAGEEKVVETAIAGRDVDPRDLDAAAAVTLDCRAVGGAALAGVVVVQAVVESARTYPTVDPAVLLRGQHRRIEELPAAMFPGLGADRPSGRFA